MRKVVFVLHSHYKGGTNLEEEFEFPDDYSDEDIQLEFEDWLYENTTQDAYWEEVE